MGSKRTNPRKNQEEDPKTKAEPEKQPKTVEAKPIKNEEVINYSSVATTQTTKGVADTVQDNGTVKDNTKRNPTVAKRNSLVTNPATGKQPRTTEPATPRTAPDPGKPKRFHPTNTDTNRPKKDGITLNY